MHFAQVVGLRRLRSPESAKNAALGLTAALSLSLTGAVSHAALLDGHGQPNGNWSTPTNWQGNVAPTSGSPNLEVVLARSPDAAVTNQDLGNPFELQRLTVSLDPHELETQRTVNGAPLAFSNLGAPPSIRALDNGQALIVNNDLILNDNVTISSYGAITSAAAYVYLNGAISGSGGLRTAPLTDTGGFDQGYYSGAVHISGATPNTYAGLTTVNYGHVYLSKPASTIAVPGDLVINRPLTVGTTSVYGRVYVMNDDQIAATSTVTLNGGRLFLEGGDQTLANVRFTGKQNTFGDVYTGGRIDISPGRTLTVTGEIVRTLVPFELYDTTSTITGGTLDLNGGTRTIRVDGEMWPLTQLTINSNVVNGDIAKTGGGDLFLNGSFGGNIFANEGRLTVGANMTFGLNNGGLSNRIAGTIPASFGGRFIIDNAAITDLTGSWNLVDVDNLDEYFGSGFKVQLKSGVQFAQVGSVYKAGRWEFSPLSGNLTLATPEPAAVSMLAASAVALAGAARRRRSA